MNQIIKQLTDALLAIEQDNDDELYYDAKVYLPLLVERFLSGTPLGDERLQMYKELLGKYYYISMDNEDVQYVKDSLKQYLNGTSVPIAESLLLARKLHSPEMLPIIIHHVKRLMNDAKHDSQVHECVHILCDCITYSGYDANMHSADIKWNKYNEQSRELLHLIASSSCPYAASQAKDYLDIHDL